MSKSLIQSLSSTWSNELCAEHDGTIASFEKLSFKIADIEDYAVLFERKKLNLSRTGKYAGLTAVGVGCVAATAMTAGVGAGPVAAAIGKLGLLGTTAKGTAIASLHGAALTNASLAAIGGSMAAGTAIISASGLSLGGVLGGVIANQYYSEDKSFKILKLKESGAATRTVFINGFTQENEIGFEDWQAGQEKAGPVPTMYALTWSSKTNAKLGIALSKGITSQAAKAMLISVAKSGSKKAAEKLSPLGFLFLATDLISNPWHCSMVRAAQAGVMLAEAISRTEGQRFNLVGHSLGCRVIFYALESLSTKSERYINDVILLGGAVGNKDWEKALSSVGGNLYNCHSDRDSILSRLYTSANAFLSTPIGIEPIALDHPNLRNINCTHLVGSHMDWKKQYGSIIKKIQHKTSHVPVLLT